MSSDAHIDSLCRALDVSVLLCENHCIAPPGFAIECTLAREALRRRRVFVAEQLIRFPMREPSIGEYIEKKRREYSGYQAQYGGIYNEGSLRFLVDEESAFLGRTTEIGKSIADAWNEGPDRPASLWKPIKGALLASDVEAIRRIPGQLIEAGTAATWPAIEANLPTGGRSIAADIRRVLQNNYFKLYIKEFNLVVISNLPWMLDDFQLAGSDATYDYRYFSSALSSLGLKTVFLQLQPESIIRLKRNFGFIEFLDVYSKIGGGQMREAAMQVLLGRAARTVHFEAESLVSTLPTRNGLFDLSDTRLAEIGDGLSAVAGEAEKMARDAERFPARLATAGREAPSAVVELAITAEPGQIALFVALRSELSVLVKQLGLFRGGMSGPQATGVIQGVPVDVVCPYEMGRVNAAVSMMQYLQSRQANPPKLIVIGGLAGGFEEEKVHKGHIIVGSAVVDLATRKVRDADGRTETEFRRRDFALSNAIARFLDSGQFNRDEWERAAIEEAEWPQGLRPALHFGLITSLDEVVSSESWRAELLKATPKLLGVEMEAGGVCAAADLFRVPVALLRTVSDAADPAKKDDQWRTIGMKTLAILLKRLDLSEILRYLQ